MPRKIPSLAFERETPYPIKNRSNELLVGVLHEPAKPSDTLVIAAHGFRCSKERPGLIKHICLGLAREGFAAYRFDFSGNGDSEGRFEDATPRKLLNDLDSVVEHFLQKYRRILLFGHSMGGYLCILLAAVRNVDGIITLGAPMHGEERFLNQFSPEQREQLSSVGFTTISHPTPYGNFSLTLKDVFLQELRQLLPLEAARSVHCPVLIAHGTADKIVPVSDSEELFCALQKKEMFLIGGADHVISNPEHLDALIRRMIGWLRVL
jgi:alpha-beta hydrolase superfamily lysophospholipase